MNRIWLEGDRSKRVLEDVFAAEKIVLVIVGVKKNHCSVFVPYNEEYIKHRTN